MQNQRFQERTLLPVCTLGRALPIRIYKLMAAECKTHANRSYAISNSIFQEEL